MLEVQLDSRLRLLPPQLLSLCIFHEGIQYITVIFCSDTLHLYTCSMLSASKPQQRSLKKHPERPQDVPALQPSHRKANLLLLPRALRLT